MKNMILLLGLFLCLCASSWGAYTTSGSPFYQKGYSGSYSEGCSVVPSCPSSLINPDGTSYKLTNPQIISNSCPCYSYGCLRSWSCGYFTSCDTQAEVDSVVISQKCATGVMAKDTANGNIFDVCQNGEGLLISFNNPITGVRNSSIGYYIVTDDSADLLDEATYNHLAALACTEVSLYRGVLNGKYVYWYSTDPEPAGVVNVVRIK